MATATETKKAGEKTTLSDVAIVSELKDLGWKALKQTDGSGYVAHEIKGDRKVGPATTLKALKTQVNLASGPPVEKGNGKVVAPDDEYAEQRLPTMEEPQIDELNMIADRCITAKEARDKAKTLFDDECDRMREKMREYERKRYNRRGFSLVIEDSEKLVIKKAEQAAPKNPSTKRAPKVVKGGRSAESE